MWFICGLCALCGLCGNRFIVRFVSLLTHFKQVMGAEFSSSVMTVSFITSLFHKTTEISAFRSLFSFYPDGNGAAVHERRLALCMRAPVREILDITAGIVNRLCSTHILREGCTARINSILAKDDLYLKPAKCVVKSNFINILL